MTILSESRTSNILLMNAPITASGESMASGALPGGHVNAAEGMVTLDLCNRSNKSIDIGYGFSVNDKNGKQVAYRQFDGPFNFAPVGVAAAAGDL